MTEPEWRPIRPDVAHGVYGKTILDEGIKVVLTRVVPDGGFGPHRDPYGHVFCFLRGEGVVTVGEQRLPVHPELIVRVAAGEVHAYANTGPADLLLISLNVPDNLPEEKKTMQPFFHDLFNRLRELHQDIAQALAGLPQDALDWVPGKEMNSLAVLAAHTAGAERYWIGEVAGGQPSGRDREAEFRAAGLDAAALGRLLDEAEACAQEVLERLTLADLEAPRTAPRDGRPCTVGWALAHALEHTGVHLGHMQIVRQLWDKWADMPGWLPKVEPTVNPASVVTLREVTQENLFAILKLSNALTPPQKHMVATNALSIAEAHYDAEAWYRAIYADETPVGFIMLHDSPEGWGYFLWRLMVAAPYQRMGFARRAIGLLIDYVKTRPGAPTTLTTSCGEGLGSPEGFYQRLGFVRDGKMYDDEVGLSMPLPE